MGYIDSTKSENSATPLPVTVGAFIYDLTNIRMHRQVYKRPNLQAVRLSNLGLYDICTL